MLLTLHSSSFLSLFPSSFSSQKLWYSLRYHRYHHHSAQPGTSDISSYPVSATLSFSVLFSQSSLIENVSAWVMIQRQGSFTDMSPTTRWHGMNGAFSFWFLLKLAFTVLEEVLTWLFRQTGYRNYAVHIVINRPVWHASISSLGLSLNQTHRRTPLSTNPYSSLIVGKHGPFIGKHVLDRRMI